MGDGSTCMHHRTYKLHTSYGMHKVCTHSPDIAWWVMVWQTKQMHAKGKRVRMHTQKRGNTCMHRTNDSWLMSAPATLEPSEQLWSLAAQIVTICRAWLDSKLIGDMMFLKENCTIMNKHYQSVTEGIQILPMVCLDETNWWIWLILI